MFFDKVDIKPINGNRDDEPLKLDDLLNYDYIDEDILEEYGSQFEEEELKEIEELENEITEQTTIVRHCNTTDDCYKIYRDSTVECVPQINTAKGIKTHSSSSGICKQQGCKRNNDNCYHGELCIKNNCVPVSEVKYN